VAIEKDKHHISLKISHPVLAPIVMPQYGVSKIIVLVTRAKLYLSKLRWVVLCVINRKSKLF
jgi:hypothetical protein